MSEMYQIICPVCGKNVPIKENTTLDPFTIDPSEYGFISIRSRGPGPGRGHRGEPGRGLHRIGKLTLIEALMDPRFSVLAEGQRQRLIQMVKSYLASGVIEINEVT